MTTTAKESWEIEVGNAARLTETIAYHGTRLGAVRKAHKRWRARAEDEDVLFVCRPGCRPTLLINNGGAQSGPGL